VDCTRCAPSPFPRPRGVAGLNVREPQLLIGDKSGRKRLLAEYEQMHQAPVVAHRDVVAFVRDGDYTGVVSAGQTRTYWRRRSLYG